MGPRGAQVNLPTYDGSGQVVHPSVIKLSSPKNGHTWWMAMTPYPNAQERYENPSVLCSTDGQTWRVPPGMSNPIDNQTGNPAPHNSDAHICVGPSGELVVSWRMVDRPSGNRNRFFWRTSSDGINWSPKREILNTTTQLLSQSLRWTGVRWEMYVIDATQDYTLQRLWTTDRNPSTGTGWNREKCEIDTQLPATRRLWHQDTVYAGGSYWCLLNDRGVGSEWVGSQNTGELYLAKSKDGLRWNMATRPPVEPDPNGLSRYKGCVFPVDGEIHCWYTTFTTANSTNWRVRHTKLDLPTSAAEYAARAESNVRFQSRREFWQFLRPGAGVDLSQLTCFVADGVVFIQGMIVKPGGFGGVTRLGYIPEGLRAATDLHTTQSAQGVPVNVSIGTLDGLVRVWSGGNQANLYMSTSWVLPKPRTL